MQSPKNYLLLAQMSKERAQEPQLSTSLTENRRSRLKNMHLRQMRCDGKNRRTLSPDS